jgi:hypothetical protein
MSELDVINISDLEWLEMQIFVESLPQVVEGK